jgi:hypothetical protein
MSEAIKTNTAATQQRKLNLQMREILGNAYAFVRGREYTKSASLITFEQLLDEAITRIEGGPIGAVPRGTLLDRIKKIKNEVSSAVDTVKKQPASKWELKSEGEGPDDTAVNTEV